MTLTGQDFVEPYSHQLNFLVGTKTPPNASTDFKPLQKLVFSLLRNNSVRSPRSLKVVLKTLQVLQDKFSGEISEEALPAFPDEYFTCSTRLTSSSSGISRQILYLQHQVIFFLFFFFLFLFLFLLLFLFLFFYFLFFFSLYFSFLSLSSLSLFFSFFLGSGPGRGRSPVEWEEIPYICLFVPLGWQALRSGWRALRSGWQALRSGCLAPFYRTLSHTGAN